MKKRDKPVGNIHMWVYKLADKRIENGIPAIIGRTYLRSYKRESTEYRKRGCFGKVFA